ncbi:MAG TPA: hypothetical protein EYQ68_06200, partial [Cytophagales bacterium]|nr:hypothetical protein [Cytophagales bacterium]
MPQQACAPAITAGDSGLAPRFRGAFSLRRFDAPPPHGAIWPHLIPNRITRAGSSMKIIIVGGGGREHALAWKLAQSPGVDEIVCAPGNAGTAALGKNVVVAAEDIEGIVALAR